MNIQIDSREYNQNDKTIKETAYTASKQTSAKALFTSKVSNTGVLTGSAALKGNEAYGSQGLLEQGSSFQELMSKIQATDVSTMQNYMTVMSNTLSDADYQSLMEDGFQPSDMTPEELVTVVDEIKAKLAEAGIVIEGYNDNLDVEKLEQITNHAGYARAIASGFEKYGVEPTEENIEETLKEIQKFSEVSELSDSAKKYLIENNKSLTSDNIYVAAFSGKAVTNSQSKGYFAEDSYGYYGKKAETTDMQSLMGQIDRVIEEAGLTVNEETRKEAGWLVEQGVLLTDINLLKLHAIESLDFPMNVSEITDACARAISDGVRPKEALLTESQTLLEQAVSIQEHTQEISDKAIYEAVESGKKITLSSLYYCETHIVITASNKEIRQQEGTSFVDTAKNEAYLTTKRQLEEIRLQMTVSANYQLLKKGYYLDTKPLEDVLEALKLQEQETAKTLFPKEPENYSLWKESDLKVAQLRMMPAAVVGGLVSTEVGVTITLTALHETGAILQDKFDKAQDSYETLMTAPRADLGDSIRKAFRNVDDILNDLGKELTYENQRAVRILAHNEMAITPEQIDSVKEADAYLQDIVKKMNPKMTLQMIRDGVNPLEASLEELNQYLNAKENSFAEEAEEYSKFLYNLEQNKAITKEEREAYIGVYRMLHQVEKADGAAIGAVVKNAKELNFANLLSAARSRRVAGMDVKLEEKTGLLNGVNTSGKSISSQIQGYFDEFVTDEVRRQYVQEEISQLKQAVQVSDDVIELLMAYKQEVTPDHLMAQKELLSNRGSMYKTINQADKSKKLQEKSAKLLEHFTDMEEAVRVYDEVVSYAKEVLEDAMYEGEASYIDVRSMVLTCKQLSLAANLSKEENYEVPVMLEGEMTSVNVKVLHNKGQKGCVEIAFESVSYGNVSAKFSLQGEKDIKGLVVTDKKDGVSGLQQKQFELCENILKETGKNADVICVHSDRGYISEVADRQDTDVDVATGDLYRIAKGFLQAFATM